jgi:hypothetical protein
MKCAKLNFEEEHATLLATKINHFKEPVLSPRTQGCKFS